MNSINCPLCNSLNTRLLETTSASIIENQYVRSFGINTNLKTDKISYFLCDDCQLGFFQPMAAGDALLYEQLQQYEWYYVSDKPEYAIAKRYLPDTGGVLEVGSGKAAFADVVRRSRYVGLEFNDEAISRARKDGVTLLKESIEDHAENNRQKYSAVVAFQVLEHVPRPASFIKGCVDSLQKGGCLIVAVPNHDGICGLAQNHLLDLPPHHVTHWTKKTLEKVATIFGLELYALEYEPIAEYHILWARRSIFEAQLRHLFRMKSSVLDTSIFARIISITAAILAKIIPIATGDLKGHAVVAVYRKA